MVTDNEISQSDAQLAPLKLFDPTIVFGKRIALVGRLGGMSRKDFRQLLDHNGGQLVDVNVDNVDLIVQGAESPPITVSHPPFDGESRLESAVQVLQETELWQALGFVEPESVTGRLYTPGMLADLLGVPVTTIRRWCRRGLIRPARQFKKLAYFDFEEVASARRIARLIADGNSPEVIETKLAKMASQFSEQSRPLSQLSVIVEGKNVLLRQGDGLIEPGGQKVIDFDLTDEFTIDESDVIQLAIADEFEHEDEDDDEDDDDDFCLTSADDSIYSFHAAADPDQLIDLAVEFEDEGNLQSSIEVYRSLALNCGGRADISFRLAELLYQNGELAASRERYFSAIELDPNFVEARASLGCVLVELGETELAISAFHGALEQHPDFPDVHFHLAKLSDELGDAEKAETHWRTFLQLAPKSPWADEARDALANRPN